MATTITPGIMLIILAITIAISLGAGYAVSKYEDRTRPADLSQPAHQPAEKPAEPLEHTALKVTLDQSLAWHLTLDDVPVPPGTITPEQRARLVNILVQIRPWIDGKAAPAAAPTAPAPVPTPQVALAPTPPLAATVANKTQPPPPALVSEPIKIDPMRGFRSLITSDVKNIEKTKPLSIVAMIDDFLQRRLAATQMADREIRLEEGSFGEVIVMIGKNSYPGVEAVPDPEIQAMIRAAIADWEKTT